MTDKQTVIRQHPKARCVRLDKLWAVIPADHAAPLGTGRTWAEAWRAAAEKLNQAANEQTEPQ